MEFQDRCAICDGTSIDYSLRDPNSDSLFCGLAHFAEYMEARGSMDAEKKAHAEAKGGASWLGERLKSETPVVQPDGSLALPSKQ